MLHFICMTMPDLENPLENCLWTSCILNSYASISLIVHPPLESLDPPLQTQLGFNTIYNCCKGICKAIKLIIIINLIIIILFGLSLSKRNPEEIKGYLVSYLLYIKVAGANMPQQFNYALLFSASYIIEGQ